MKKLIAEFIGPRYCGCNYRKYRSCSMRLGIYCGTVCGCGIGSSSIQVS